MNIENLNAQFFLKTIVDCSEVIRFFNIYSGIIFDSASEDCIRSDAVGLVQPAVHNFGFKSSFLFTWPRSELDGVDEWKLGIKLANYFSTDVLVENTDIRTDTEKWILTTKDGTQRLVDIIVIEDGIDVG